MLATLPGLPSFNLRSGKPFPPGLGGGAWMASQNDTVQSTAVREMQAQPHPCAIYYPKALDVWVRDREFVPTPMVRYILGLEQKFETNGYRFLANPDPSSAP
jgi:hypothetical protein